MSVDSTIYDCNIIHLPKIQNVAGNITPVTNFENVPFKIRRIFYLYDIPGGESRGAHAHKELEQFIVAASGSFDITLDDGRNKKTVILNRPYLGIHIRTGIWSDLSNFSSGAICLAITSDVYHEADYIRDYSEFRLFKGVLRKPESH
jgi:hypothetical protein